MKYATREVARRLGLHFTTFHKYLREKKLPQPPLRVIGGVRLRLWSDAEIERVRKLLPKIANGRKTRYQKLREKNKQQARAFKPKPVSRKKK